MIYEHPIGVMPRWLWIESRMGELARAVTRYLSAGRGKDRCVGEWALELLQLHEELEVIKK